MKDKPTATSPQNARHFSGTAPNNSIGQKNAILDDDLQMLLKKYGAVQRRKERKAHTDSIKHCVMTLVFIDRIGCKLLGKETLKLPYLFAEVYKGSEDDLKCALKFYQENFSDGKNLPLFKGFELKTINEKVLVSLNLELKKKETDASQLPL